MDSFSFCTVESKIPNTEALYYDKSTHMLTELAILRSLLGGLGGAGGGGVWAAVIMGRREGMDSILIGGRGAEPGTTSPSAASWERIPGGRDEVVSDETGKELCRFLLIGSGGGEEDTSLPCSRDQVFRLYKSGIISNNASNLCFKIIL